MKSMSFLLVALLMQLFACAAGESVQDLIQSIDSADLPAVEAARDRYLSERGRLIKSINSVFAKPSNWKEQKVLVSSCLALVQKLKCEESIDVLLESWQYEILPSVIENSNTQYFVEDSLNEIGIKAVMRTIDFVADGKLPKKQAAANALVCRFFPNRD